jgi:hypothetical protein
VPLPARPGSRASREMAPENLGAPSSGKQDRLGNMYEASGVGHNVVVTVDARTVGAALLHALEGACGDIVDRLDPVTPAAAAEACSALQVTELVQRGDMRIPRCEFWHVRELARHAETPLTFPLVSHRYSNAQGARSRHSATCR